MTEWLERFQISANRKKQIEELSKGNQHKVQFLATIYASLGAMVKRQDEVQSAIMLPMLLLSSGYVVIFLAVQSPDATWVKVLSFLPFWTPTLMLVRLALGTVYWWDIALSIVLMLVTICACAWFSVRINRFGVLMYGQKPSFGQLLKLARLNEPPVNDGF